MDLPNDVFYLLVLIALVGIAMSLVSYLTKDSRNFRSSRNRRARKQF